MNVQDRRIVVIDDDFRVLESLVNLLRSFGYHWVTSRPLVSRSRGLSAASETIRRGERI